MVHARLAKYTNIFLWNSTSLNDLYVRPRTCLAQMSMHVPNAHIYKCICTHAYARVYTRMDAIKSYGLCISLDPMPQTDDCTCLHTCIRTHARTHARTHVCKRAKAHDHTHIYSRAHAHVHTYIHTHIYICVNTQACALVFAHVLYACLYTCLRTF